MHRFLIEAQTLSSDRSVWLRPPEDSTAWRYLVASFRQKIKARQWRLIDLSIRLVVTIDDHDDGQAVLVEDLATRSDYYVASAYLRAALLEGSTMMVYASDTLPWSQLRQFMAARGQRQHRQKGGALGHHGQAASASAPAMLAIEERQPEPRPLATRIRRTGRPDISAGDSLVQPQVHQGDCRDKVSSRQCLRLTGRSTARSRSPEPDDQSAGLVDKNTAEPSISI